VDAAVEEWVRGHVSPLGPIEAVHERPWATVSRVPVTGGVVWLKECGLVQSFEPRLTASLFDRWPDRVTEVIADDVDRGWLLLADAGTRVNDLGNPPELWLRALPRYAELQIGEAAHVEDHLAHGVPDLRIATLPDRYEKLVQHDLPLARHEVDRLRAFAGRFAELCAELDAAGIPASVQHDDLHMNNLYVDGAQLRVIDWGDASIAHPFFSLVINFRFFEEFNRLPPDDPWFPRLRDAYLEPWGTGLVPTFEAALRVGAFARAFQSVRLRSHLEADGITPSNEDFTTVIRRALTTTKYP